MKSDSDFYAYNSKDGYFVVDSQPFIVTYDEEKNICIRDTEHSSPCPCSNALRHDSDEEKDFEKHNAS